MRRRLANLLALPLAAAAFVAAGCGGPAAIESHGLEGEPVEVSELLYNVQMTRFLNPEDNEDAEYLSGLPAAPPDAAYLGVFLVIENEGDDPVRSAEDYVVTDTLENEYHLIESDSAYTLDIGATVPGNEQLPLPDTTPYNAFNKGSLLIFEVDDEVGENRPLQLHIESTAGDEGEVTLDI